MAGPQPRLAEKNARSPVTRWPGFGKATSSRRHDVLVKIERMVLTRFRKFPASSQVASRSVRPDPQGAPMKGRFMSSKTITAWTLFLAAVTSALQATSTWISYQQLQLTRQQQAA
jgi:hypothetical protein